MSATTQPSRATLLSGPPSFTGTGALLRLALRRDRVLLPVWALFAAALTSRWRPWDLYPTEASTVGAAQSLAADPTLSAILGPRVRPALDRRADGLADGAGMLLTLGLVVLVPRRPALAGRRGRGSRRPDPRRSGRTPPL